MLVGRLPCGPGAPHETMPERRGEKRESGPDRRGFPRPSLWLNLVLLALGITFLLGARAHRQRIDSQYSRLLARNESTPAVMNAMKAELAEMDLTREALKRELDSRVKYAESLKTEDFHLAIDTSRKKLLLHYGDQVAREAGVVIGPPTTVTGEGSKSWTFVPLKGAFAVVGKEAEATWQIPTWVYAMQKQKVPEPRPTVPGGQGKFVIYLPNNYVIHSPPSPDSPLKGAKPGSFMISEEDMKALWPRITERTKVFVF